MHSVTLMVAALMGAASAMPGQAWKPGHSYGSWGTGTASASSTSSYPTASDSDHSQSSVSHPTVSSSTLPWSPYPTGSHPHGTGSVPSVTTESHSDSTTTTWVTGTAPETVTLTVPITSVVTSFVPCSTAVAQSSGTTYYSTWLTATSYTTVYTTTSCQTLYPTAPVAPVSPTPKTSTVAESASHSDKPHVTISPSISTSATTLPPTTVWGPASDTCPPAQTVYSTIVSYTTVYETPAPVVPCKTCKVETWTVTLGGGFTTTITRTMESSTPTATPWTPGQSHSFSSSSATGSGSKTRSGGARPTGTGAGHPLGSGHAKPSGWAKPTGW